MNDEALRAELERLLGRLVQKDALRAGLIVGGRGPKKRSAGGGDTRGR